MASESQKEEEKVATDLFKDVTYYVVGDISQKVLDLLNAGGAKHDSYLSEMVSHVIADDHTQSEYSEAKELFDLPVVTSQWVILSVKCKKQLIIKQFAPEGLLFSGVVACCSQLEPEDTKAVWAMITFHGGKCQKSLDRSCTHLITTEMNGAKFESAENHEEQIKVVCPDWVTESIRKEERLDEIIFHPKLIKPPTPEPTPPPTPPPPPPVIEQPPPLPYPEPMEIQEVIAKQQAKQHAQMMKSYAQQQARFQKEMGIGRSPAKQVIAQQLVAAVLERRGSIEEGGQGSRLPNPSAKQALARMVNSRIQGTRPGNKSPVGIPPPGLQLPPHSQFPPGMLPFRHDMMQHRQNVPRTLRNITNSADQRQQGPGAMRPNKVPPMGSRPPPPRYGLPQMGPLHQQKQSHPSLPTLPPTYWGHDPSDKLPPDLCLLGCVFYITDYFKLLGQEQLDNWKKVIEQHGGQVDPAYSNRVTHLLCANQQSDVFHIALKDQRRVVTAFWLNDVLVKKKMLPPWQALHLPIIYSDEKPCCNQILCMTNFNDEERLRVKQMISAIGAKYTGYMSHTNSAMICNRPEGKKFEKAKDWQIPVVNVQWLSDLVLGHLDALKIPVHQKYLVFGQQDQFHLDVMKVSHLMVGWQVPLKIQKETWKKFLPQQKAKAMAASDQENIMLNVPKQTEVNEPVKKRQRLEVEDNIISNVYPRVLFTGFPKGLAKKLQMMVLQLNGMVTESPKQCTHLVSPTLSRTMKFFIAINVCKHVVTKEWLENSISQNQFVDETPYALKDVKSENEMQCNLQESLKRAQTQPLFEGLTFYISPSVTPPPYDLTKIIESAHGRVVRARQSSRAFAAQKDENGNSKHVMITCENDIHLFRDLIAKKIPVHNAEFVLTGVMRQTVDFKSFQIDVH